MLPLRPEVPKITAGRAVLPGGLSFYLPLTDNRINYGPVLRTSFIATPLRQGCKVSNGRIESWNVFHPQKPRDGLRIRSGRNDHHGRPGQSRKREYRPFAQIMDNYPKYLLTRSDVIQQRDGIIHANIPEFMQEGAFCVRAMPPSILAQAEADF